MNMISSHVKDIRFDFLLSLFLDNIKVKSQSEKEKEISFNKGIGNWISFFFFVSIFAYICTLILYFIVKNLNPFLPITSTILVLISFFAGYLYLSNAENSKIVYKGFLYDVDSDDETKSFKARITVLNYYFTYPLSLNDKKIKLLFDVLAYLHFEKSNDIRVANYFQNNAELFKFLKEKVLTDIVLAHQNQYKYDLSDENHALIKVIKDILNESKINKVDETLSQIIRENKYWRILFNSVQEEIKWNDKTPQEIQDLKNKLLKENENFKQMYKDKVNSPLL